MKPFLGIDLTQDKTNDSYNGEEFIVQKPSEGLLRALEKSSDEAFDMIFNKSKLPLIFRVIYWVLGIVGFCGLMAIIRLVGEEEIPFTEIFEKAPWVFFAIIACLIVWAVLVLIARKKEKTVLESDENENINRNLDSISDSILFELSVPSYAKLVDILSFTYKIKNGAIKPHERGFEESPYNNFEYSIFKDNENLYLANLDGKCAIPLAALKSIHTVKKSVTIPVWNKDDKPDKQTRKQYKLSVGDYGEITFKTHYILEFEHGGESWGVYFPNYELPTFEEITGLKAETI